MNPLIIPQISINGSPREMLVDQQRAVLAALLQAQHAMAQATPHGRDYQHRPDEYPAARDAWIERAVLVSELVQEITRHALKIQDDTDV